MCKRCRREASCYLLATDTSDFSPTKIQALAPRWAKCCNVDGMLRSGVYHLLYTCRVIMFWASGCYLIVWHILVRTRVYTHTHLYIYIYTLCICVCVCVCMYIYIYIYPYILNCSVLERNSVRVTYRFTRTGYWKHYSANGKIIYKAEKKRKRTGGGEIRLRNAKKSSILLLTASFLETVNTQNLSYIWVPDSAGVNYWYQQANNRLESIILFEKSLSHFTTIFLCDGRQCSASGFSSLLLAGVHAFYFHVLQLILSPCSPYLKKVLEMVPSCWQTCVTSPKLSVSRQGLLSQDSQREVPNDSCQIK